MGTAPIEASVSSRMLYYPYSRMLYAADLKRAALIFDEILFVDPLSTDVTWQPAQGLVGAASAHANVRSEIDMVAASYLNGYIGRDEFESQQLQNQFLVGGPGSSDTLLKWYDAAEMYETLAAADVVKLVPSTDLISPYQELNSYSIVGDLASIYLGSASGDVPRMDSGVLAKPSIMGWLLHGSRFPVQLENMANDVDQVTESVRLLTGDFEDTAIARAVDRVCWDLQEVEGDREHGLLTSYRLGLFLVVNQAMLLADLTEASLVTDDPFAQHLINWKYARASRTAGLSGSALGEGPTAYGAHLHSFQHAVVTRLIPDSILDQVPIEGVIEYRLANRALLDRFKAEMASLAVEIEVGPWQATHTEAIQRKIDNQVLPLVRELDDALISSFNKLFSGVVEKIGTATASAAASAVPALSLAALIGFTPASIAVAGGAALMTGLGLVLPSAVEHWRDTQSRRRNGLTYLLDFRASSVR